MVSPIIIIITNRARAKHNKFLHHKIGQNEIFTSTSSTTTKHKDEALPTHTHIVRIVNIMAAQRQQRSNSSYNHHTQSAAVLLL